VINAASAAGFSAVVWDVRLSQYVRVEEAKASSWQAWAAVYEGHTAAIVLAQTEAGAVSACYDSLAKQAKADDGMARVFAAWLTSGQAVEERSWLAAPIIYTLADFA
jgi:hypothetical protein